MYSASQEFHDAVANGAHQIALLIFEDAVFTNDDINVTNGIVFNDYFNTEEDLTIGKALSNEISFYIFNDHRLLNEYEFGQFTATIGAQIGTDEVFVNGTVYVETASHAYVASDSSPYLTRDGSAVSSQPPAPVSSMLAYDGIVYCRLVNGNVVGYRDSNGSIISVSMNSFMKMQMSRWEGKGICYSKAQGENWKLRIWNCETKRTYEFVPLGVFVADRPNVPYVNEISFTCYDRMQEFEIDMPSDADLDISWPSTFSNLYIRMCSYLDVEYASSYFFNSTATISARPDEFDNATMRDVLAWLAEAAGSVARFDRDGILVMDWIHNTDQAFNESGYVEFNPYWYETSTVTKLDNRASDGSYENTVGDGTETYLIQDNPLLKGVT